MAVIASLVVGANNATSLGGLSAGLSTPEDRARFLSRHRSAAAFIIGKVSAASESYRKTSVPIFVFSRNSAPLNFSHPLMQQITVDRNLGEITKRIDERIPGDVVVEAGASLLLALVEAGAVDLIELSITNVKGDGNFIDLGNLLTHFTIELDEEISGTRLLQGRYKRDSANS